MFRVLARLKRSEAILDISDNAKLTTVSGFGALESVKNMSFDSNVVLATLSEFEGLKTVADLFVNNNQMLPALPTFASLTTIGGIVVSNNTLLASISGFGSLTTISGNVDIQRNGMLSSCCGLLVIADGTLVPGGSTNTISNNATGCSSPEEVETTCTISSGFSINADGDVPSHVSLLRRITGDLTIGGTITSFPNFAALEVVQGNLVIDNITTATLTDLNNIFPALDSVRGNLQILSNAQVETITGFAELDSVGGFFNFQNNAALTAVPVFDALTNAGGIGISINAALTAIPTFSKITTTQNVSITNNIGLTAISGFNALTRITNFDLTITDNAQLETIAGFDVLERVERAFGIERNVKLTTLPTFNALTHTGGFGIAGNTALTTISGFEALATVPGNFTIRGNTALASCCAFLPIANNTLTPGGTTDISGNKAGCNTQAQITNTCAADITIAQDSDVPGNVANIKRITGDLTIGGTITTFPNFADLEVIEGNLDINGITTATLTALADIFPALKRVDGNFVIQNNTQVATITGLGALNNLGGTLLIQINAMR